jgi:hypothetical protein
MFKLPSSIGIHAEIGLERFVYFYSFGNVQKSASASNRAVQGSEHVIACWYEFHKMLFNYFSMRM